MRGTKSTYVMLAYNCASFKVNSQNPKFTFAFGSPGLRTEGSTRPGPGFSKKVNLLSMDIQSLAPANCGTVTHTVFPGGPSGIAQSTSRGEPTLLTSFGKYSSFPFAWIKHLCELC